MGDQKPAEKLKALVGAAVSRIQFGYDIGITISGGQNRKNKYAELRINPPFRLESDKGSWTIDPDRTETMAPMLQILQSKIDDIVYTEDESITLTFSNGYRFTVNAIPKYEAWILTGDDLGFYVATGK